MKDFKNTDIIKDDSDIKLWITENKVLFVTNSPCMPGSMFLSSIMSYAQFIPIHNFHIIYGINDNKPFYGVNAFLDMIAKCISERIFMNFDYVIYIDEDAFITDFSILINEFQRFIENDAYCIGGPQDGGVICHRNHSSLMINTFISFWNMKLIRKKCTSPQAFVKIINDISTVRNNSYRKFVKLLSTQNADLFTLMNANAERMITAIKDFRVSTFKNKNGESPYADTVRNDPNNRVEQHQTPYSTSNDRETYNYEPYYVLEQALVLITDTPIYYMFATDLYNPDNIDKCDNSGLTSAVYDTSDEHNLFCVHTWYSRNYSKWPANQQMFEQTNRINSVISKYGWI